MRFVLEHVVDSAGLAKLQGYEHADPDTVAGILDEAGRFFAEQFTPLNRVGDLQHSRRNEDGSVTTPEGFPKAYARYVEAGWPAVPFPPEYGGGGFPWLVGVAMQETMTAANMGFSLCPLLTQGAIDMLLHFGSEEQQAYVTKMVSGQWTGTMNLTEPQAGSDVGALTTRAVPADDGTWRITGQKIFITYGEHDLAENIVHLVLARVPEAPPGTKGISCFIVPKFLLRDDGSLGERNAVECVSIEEKLGINASPTCVMAYDDAVGYLIGEPNQGMRYMFTMMNTARLSVGLEGLAIGSGRTSRRWRTPPSDRQGRAPGASSDSTIVEHADVRRMLLTMKAYIEALRCLMYLNAELIDLATHGDDETLQQARDELADLLTPISKGWGTDVGCLLASLAIQVHGGMGYVEESGRRPALPRRAHRPDLRRDERHSGDRPRRAQGADARAAASSATTSTASPPRRQRRPPRPATSRCWATGWRTRCYARRRRGCSRTVRGPEQRARRRDAVPGDARHRHRGAGC